jgi:hypothetical protein
MVESTETTNLLDELCFDEPKEEKQAKSLGTDDHFPEIIWQKDKINNKMIQLAQAKIKARAKAKA